MGDPQERDKLLTLTKTERKALLKLELPVGDGAKLQQAISKVGENLYGISSNPFTTKSEDSNAWYATDSLFTSAKKTYNGILRPFLEQPQVYKLDVTKEKVRRIDPKYVPPTALDEYPDVTVDENALSSYIDPFALPAPWQLKMIGDKTFYFNSETFERVEQVLSVTLI